MAPPTRSSKLRSFLGVLALLGPACATTPGSNLPESAAPKGSLVDPSQLEDGDLIPYRKLTRADFKGTKVPPEFASVADQAGATTCGRIVTPDLELEVHGVKKASGAEHYKSKVRKLGFRALMDRKCSWWNDKVASDRPDYVLEHEQIHFAIFELGARQLNARSGEIARDMESEGSSPEELKEHALDVHTKAMQGALESIMERSHDFDEDTSLGYKPDRQKAWLKRITKELADTAHLAR
jgi:hypothetical protein